MTIQELEVYWEQQAKVGFGLTLCKVLDYVKSALDVEVHLDPDREEALKPLFVLRE